MLGKEAHERLKPCLGDQPLCGVSRREGVAEEGRSTAVHALLLSGFERLW